MDRPDPDLEAGETLMFHDAPRRDAYFWVFPAMLAVPFTYFVSPFIASEYLDYPWPEAIAFVGFILFYLPLDVLLIARLLDRWRLAITDRRVIVRRWPLGLRRSEMRLAEIADVRHEWRRSRLVLTAETGRTLGIRCREATAQAILETLIEFRKRGPSPP